MKIYNCFKNISQEFRFKNIVHELEPKKNGQLALVGGQNIM